MPTELHIGQRVTGQVVKLMPFGAFVRLDASDVLALVKIPEIAWQTIRHPADVLTVGQSVEAEILFIDAELRIILSIKRCQPAPE